MARGNGIGGSHSASRSEDFSKPVRVKYAARKVQVVKKLTTLSGSSLKPFMTVDGRFSDELWITSVTDNKAGLETATYIDAVEGALTKLLNNLLEMAKEAIEIARIGPGYYAADMTAEQAISTLKSHQLITGETAQRLHRMRKLRNDLQHDSIDVPPRATAEGVVFVMEVAPSLTRMYSLPLHKY